MISVNELRIGNYFHPRSTKETYPDSKLSALDKIRGYVGIPLSGVYHRVGSIDKFGEVSVFEQSTSQSLRFNSQYIFGVDLNREIFNKCGWKERKAVESLTITHTQFDSNEYKNIIIRVEAGYNVYMYNAYNHGIFYVRKLKYLHELQNLFFVVTGEELKIEL